MDLRKALEDALGDSYTLERELGGGGMSRVFVAEERALARKVVIKVLPPELAARVSIERFNRELMLAAQLQHPHIVPVHAHGQASGLPYYTMPVVIGESVRECLARSGAMSASDAVGVLRDVAKALAAAVPFVRNGMFSTVGMVLCTALPRTAKATCPTRPIAPPWPSVGLPPDVASAYWSPKK